jgi:glycerophosphoryl diester phosphodiesterase
MRGSDRFLRIGHRGAAALEPENTLRSITRALDLGVEMVEIDVRASADGRLVVAHDDELRSVTGETFRVSTLDVSALRRFDMGKGERLLTVDDALAALRGRALVNLDLKVEGVARPLLAAVRHHGMAGDAIVTGDIVTSFGYLKAEEPGLWVGLSVDAPRLARSRALLEAQIPQQAVTRAADLAHRAAAVRADALMLQYTQISVPLVRELHRRGLLVYAWTVDDAGAMARLKAQGVDGITSNRVDVLMRIA